MKIYHFTAISFVFSLCIFSFSGLKGQIIITPSDMPKVGENILTYTDTAVTVTPQNPSSLAQTWNFSSLQKPETNNNLIVSPSATPYATTFPGANIADSLVYAPGYYYYLSTSSSYSEVGYVTHLYGYTAGINFHPLIVQLPLPATYNMIDGGICHGDTSIPISYGIFDSGRAIVNVYYADTIDAFGSMTTPYGTDSVIRQKHYELDLDSILVHSTSGWSLYEILKNINYQYKWYAKGIPGAFVTMQMDSVNNHVVSVTWYDSTGTLGINEVTETGTIHIYPNPCKSQITFSSTESGLKYLTVYDITGHQLSSTKMANGLAVLNTNTYPAGMYFYSISGANKYNAERGKFIVEK